jgi:hypothetical protein
LIVSWTNGYVMNNWRPNGGLTDFTFNDTLKPLEKFRDQLIVIDGVGQRVHYEASPGALGWGKEEWYGGHDAFPAITTGVPLAEYGENNEVSGGDSVDQFIAAELSKQVSLPIESLVLAPFGEGLFWGTISYKGRSRGITPETDPFNLWRTLFSDRALPEGEFDKLRAERRSVLDYLGKSLTGFGERLGSEDRLKVEAHLQSVRMIEQRLAADPLACSAPDIGPEFDVRDNVSNFPNALDLLGKETMAAFRCDLTRVATLNYSNVGGDNLVFSWLGDEFTGPGDEYPTRQFHDICHNQDRSDDHRRRMNRVSQWFYEGVANMVQELSDTPEGTGTMLDNTLVVVTNAMGSNHDSKIQPFVIIGNADNYFQTGRYLQYETSNGLGQAHNGVLVALANAMGVDGSQFGQSEYARELPNLRG